MDDPGCVRGCERAGHLDGDIERVAALHLPVLHTLPQRLAFDVFADDEMAVIYFADFMNGEDVRLVERRCRFRLLLEAANPIRIPGECWRKYFKRDFATEPRIIGQ